jgi:hypothetical protein
METEWIVLADYAEVINNKLYTMGGGWETLTANALPVHHQVGVAVAFSVPWNETNQQHDIEIDIADMDGGSLGKISGQIEVGRPPGIPLGQAQRVQMAVNFGLSFDRIGTYVVITRVEDQESKRITFRVVPGPGLGLQHIAERAEGSI